MRRLLSVIIISFIILNISISNAESSSMDSVFNTSLIDSGVISINYEATEDEKVKVLIEKDNEKVTYDLINSHTVENFPMQMGNGNYKISILKNIDGNKYKSIFSKTISLNLEVENNVYLNSIQTINWNKDMKVIKKAKEITEGLNNDSDKIEAIYNYVITNYKYDYDKPNTIQSGYVPDINIMFDSNKGICFDYSSIFAAMLRSVEIPTKLVKGFSDNVEGYHAWNEVYDSSNEKWIIIDTTYDSQMNTIKLEYSTEKEDSQYSKLYEY